MSNDLPARWRDDDDAPAELREVAAVLETLNQPPSTGARARVWAEVERGPRARAAVPRLAWYGAAAVLILALLAAPRLLRQNDVGRVELLMGNARLQLGQAIRAESRLTTGNGRAVVRLLDVGVAYLAESTDAAVGPAAESIVLHRGSVVASIRPRGHASPFQVVAGDYQVRVIGTLFQVSRTGNHVDVRVREGKVEVRGPKGTTMIGAGESFSSRGAAVPPIASEIVNLLGGHTPVSMIGEPDPHGVPPIAEARPRLKRRADRAAPPGPAESEPPATETAAAEEPEEAPAEEAPAAETPIPEGEKYIEAVGSADTERAIALFDELIAGGGPRAELAAYQAARLARSRDLNEAVRRYERLLSAHPSGVFGQEARLDVIECAMQLGQWDKASYHIDVFLDAYPNSERTAEVRFLRAEVARHGHDCAAAIRDYDAALSSPRRAGDAMFFKAWCLLSHEKTSEALPFLERYLERFPTGRHAEEARKRVTEIRALDH